MKTEIFEICTKEDFHLSLRESAEKPCYITYVLDDNNNSGWFYEIYRIRSEAEVDLPRCLVDFFGMTHSDLVNIKLAQVTLSDDEHRTLTSAASDEDILYNLLTGIDKKARVFWEFNGMELGEDLLKYYVTKLDGAPNPYAEDLDDDEELDYIDFMDQMMYDDPEGYDRLVKDFIDNLI